MADYKVPVITGNSLSTGDILRWDGSDWVNYADSVYKEASLSFVIDGGGITITTGIKGDLEVPFDCVINSVTLLADQVGAIVIDIWKDEYANFPPIDDPDTITSAAPPTITATADKSQDSTLTDWTTELTKGDVLRFNVDSVTDIQRVTLSLKVDKT